MSRPSGRFLQLAVWGYAMAVTAAWLTIEFWADRLWPATLLAFGPRWVTAVPVVPLAIWTLIAARRRRQWLPVVVVGATACIVMFGVLDLKLGLGRASGTASIRVMTHNLGASRVTAEALDRLMRRERIDVAALQECPFFSYEPARFGWQFFYGGNLCLVSRFPFTVLDVSDPDTVWERAGREPLRFQIEAPTGPFQVLNVHLRTIRDGIEGWTDDPRNASARFVANRSDALTQSQAARARVARTIPLIVAGDFNLPEESAIYRATWGDMGNAFSSCGRGFGHTKFTGMFGARIDHVLMTSAWRCTEAYVVATPYGGDHAALVAALRLR